MSPILDLAAVAQLNGIFAPIQDELDDAPCMIHDFAITAHHLVLFGCPFRFDVTIPDILA